MKELISGPLLVVRICFGWRGRGFTILLRLAATASSSVLKYPTNLPEIVTFHAFPLDRLATKHTPTFVRLGSANYHGLLHYMIFKFTLS